MGVTFQCLGCAHKWTLTEPPQGGTECVRCGHLYVRWVNYETWHKANPLKSRCPPFTAH